jgi:hypothetical protein
MIPKFDSLSLRVQAILLTAGITLLIVLLGVAAVKFPTVAMWLICFILIVVPLAVTLAVVVMAVIFTVYDIVYRKLKSVALMG